MARYAIGIDFGTLSARALVVEVGTGRELASATMNYPHAVMDETLPDGTRLGQDWALEHPQDYLDCLAYTIPEAMRQSGISADEVIGVGIDFTACTLLPCLADGTPLCFLPEYKSNPHAYIKLWKHHAAQGQADRLNAIATERGETFLARYGGKISSEWAIPKIWQTLEEAPEVYDAADRFIEAADWVIWQLCGREARNACTAGYKAMWSKREGYPSDDFFAALDPRLRHVVDEKLSRDIYPMGAKAGGITESAAKLTGLCPGTAVAVANVDAHVSIPAVGITEPGKFLMIMGTSTCDILLGTEEKIVPGMCGVVEDGVTPGFLGYEAGQSCVGDHFAWFVENCLPEDYAEAARARGITAQQLLTEKAQALRVGESGLLALDWWNGNRSVLVDTNLTGVMLGMTLQTKPEEMYRALVEATAYGTRMIVDTFAQSGVPIDALYACGGIAEKNPMMMQIYADVTNREIRIARSAQSPALGSAMFGAVAAGSAAGGYDRIEDAAREMGGVKDLVYRPIGENVKVYEKIYAEYAQLHDWLGRGGNDVLKRLKKIKGEA
ncbi:MAG: ribulokinase [Oscillospiraceae bacterium]|jgi:L-ribulokinase|nr:ribulokinase [Oscillospiraceae bacterium]